MSPIEIDDLGSRLGAALDQRAGTATVPAKDHGRTAIGRRLAQRGRRRRVARASASVLAIVILLAVGFGWLRSGDDGGRVATGPGVPAVRLPQVGLAGRGDVWSLLEYSPGRFEELLLWPAGTAESDVTGLLVAPDASAGGRLPTTPGSSEAGRVGGEPATVIAVPSATPAAAVVWEIAPGMRALLSSGGVTLNGTPQASTTTSPPVLDRALASRLLALANRIAPVSDATWSTELRTGRNAPGKGFKPIVPLVLGAPHGFTEIDVYEPGFRVIESLDVRGFAPGTFSLGVSVAGGPALQPDASDTVVVRGTRGSFDRDGTGDRPDELSWAEHGRVVTLSYATGPTEEQAVALADSLSVPTASQWRALLFPATLRTDLVPMPQNLFEPVLQGAAQTSVGSAPASTPTTG